MAKEKPFALQGEDAWPDASNYHGSSRGKGRGLTSSKLAGVYVDRDGNSLLQPGQPAYYKRAEERGPAGEYCPHCEARLERGDNGNCNCCGKPWPEKKADVSQSNDQLMGMQMIHPRLDCSSHNVRP